MNRAFPPWPALVAVLLAARAAGAQGGDLAAAQALFDEAKQLVAKGQYGVACPKFVASFRLDPKPGTAINLADCHEKNGQVASAWARYLEAASLAQRAGQAEREVYAREHAAALDPRLARLRVTAASPPPGLEVRRDGEGLDVAALGTAVPVDPGKHLVEARAPGKKAWSKTVEIPAGAAQIAVEIPPLEDAGRGDAGRPPGPAAPPGASSPEPAPAGGSLRRPVGLAAIGVGGAGVLVGAITGGMAVGKHTSLASICPQGMCLDQGSAVSAYHLLGTVSSVGLVAGGALAVTGIVLVATAPRAGAPAQAWVAPAFGPGFAGATGRF